ncbi:MULTISPECIES: hypothetical protein [unclassified Streptomyces]|uniref:hypothetical protein n=1 Tax=unclassified Streptomyces TaxID=2593676 RepID=UPI0008974E5E|nr:MULTISPECIES: hypothetical protein [unclassified Streptomyces]PBC84604.1 hypothetical protein BX261_4598 [Streptomyces sp. 2321.6]SED37583.1 hypothetical protein SAMN05428940_4626 [Streptomyces sp. 2133.1]
MHDRPRSRTSGSRTKLWAIATSYRKLRQPKPSNSARQQAAKVHAYAASHSGGATREATDAATVRNTSLHDHERFEDPASDAAYALANLSASMAKHAARG